MATLEPMDDRDGWIWLDGTLVPWRDVRPHVLSHGLHYGSGVFEGERIYGGRIFRLSAHSARLIRSAQLMDFDLPWTGPQIDAATREVVRANGLQSGYVRPIAWRGSEVLGVSALGTTVHLAIAPWAWGDYFSRQAKLRGIRLTMAKYRRPSAESAPGESKACGLYIICTLEKDRAIKAGFDDALMLDWKGRVAEATGANVFLVIDGKLVTPRPENFLDGITRRAVMGLARTRGIAIEEREVWPDDLRRASEVFLTGSASEITPVRELDGHHYQVGPLAPKLIDDFALLVARDDCEGFGESAHLADLAFDKVA
ncbi:MAG: branched-chain amino acid aminotransferase [Alphaproteobacteria bacterium]|nr:branched-chain amino acid aminotransferase [Alphaproteobacteria bacterium]